MKGLGHGQPSYLHVSPSIAPGQAKTQSRTSLKLCVCVCVCVRVCVENAFTLQNVNLCEKLVHQPPFWALGLTIGENLSTIEGQTA